jgi:hypothetical protein
LKVFENRVLRRIFELKRDEVLKAGENWMVRSFITFTFHQIKMINSRRIRWAVHVAR